MAGIALVRKEILKRGFNSMSWGSDGIRERCAEVFWSQNTSCGLDISTWGVRSSRIGRKGVAGAALVVEGEVKLVQ